MTKPKRFFYVKSARSTTMHRMYGTTHTEGLTACGRVVTTQWSWWQSKWWTGRQKRFRRCSQCERAG